MGANGTGGRPRGYEFFRGPCTMCGKDCALSYGDAGWIWFRAHKPCGAHRTPRGAFEMAQMKAKNPELT